MKPKTNIRINILSSGPFHAYARQLIPTEMDVSQNIFRNISELSVQLTLKEN